MAEEAGRAAAEAADIPGMSEVISMVRLFDATAVLDVAAPADWPHQQQLLMPSGRNVAGIWAERCTRCARALRVCKFCSGGERERNLLSVFGCVSTAEDCHQPVCVVCLKGCGDRRMSAGRSSCYYRATPHRQTVVLPMARMLARMAGIKSQVQFKTRCLAHRAAAVSLPSGHHRVPMCLWSGAGWEWQPADGQWEPLELAINLALQDHSVLNAGIPFSFQRCVQPSFCVSVAVILAAHILQQQRCSRCTRMMATCVVALQKGVFGPSGHVHHRLVRDDPGACKTFLFLIQKCLRF